MTTQNPKDTMISLRIFVLRDGTIQFDQSFSDEVHCGNNLVLGALDIAKTIVSKAPKDGPAT